VKYTGFSDIFSTRAVIPKYEPATACSRDGIKVIEIALLVAASADDDAVGFAVSAVFLAHNITGKTNKTHREGNTLERKVCIENLLFCRWIGVHFLAPPSIIIILLF
jgi:hypothetical protein